MPPPASARTINAPRRLWNDLILLGHALGVLERSVRALSRTHTAPDWLRAYS